MKILSTLSRALLLALSLAGPASAAIVAGNAPYTGASFGQQADASSMAYEQTFSVAGGAVLEAIQWYGFHGIDSGGSGFDQFVVTLDGVPQTGVLSRVAVLDVAGAYLYDEYTLDVLDVALVATRLSIANDSFDVEWYWQSAGAVGSPGAPSAAAVAFNLLGRTASPTDPTLPEPATWALSLLALGALTASRARRAVCG